MRGGPCARDSSDRREAGTRTSFTHKHLHLAVQIVVQEQLVSDSDTVRPHGVPLGVLVVAQVLCDGDEAQVGVRHGALQSMHALEVPRAPCVRAKCTYHRSSTIFSSSACFWLFRRPGCCSWHAESQCFFAAKRPALQSARSPSKTVFHVEGFRKLTGDSRENSSLWAVLVNLVKYKILIVN